MAWLQVALGKEIADLVPQDVIARLETQIKSELAKHLLVHGDRVEERLVQRANDVKAIEAQAVANSAAAQPATIPASVETVPVEADASHDLAGNDTADAVSTPASEPDSAVEQSNHDHATGEDVGTASEF